MPYMSTAEFLDRLGKIQTIAWQLFDGGCIRGTEVGTNREHCPITAVVWSLTGKAFHPDMACVAGKGLLNHIVGDRVIEAADDSSASAPEIVLLRAQLLRVLGLDDTAPI